MQYYQLTYLISPDFSENEIKMLQEKVNSTITEKQGVLDKIKIFGKKELGSPIKKFSQAHLIKSNFFLDSQKLEDFKKKLKEENKILRFSILKEKMKKPLKIKRGLIPAIIKEKPGYIAAPAGNVVSAADEQNVAKRKKISVSKQTKVELKEIDKKLEEILGE